MKNVRPASGPDPEIRRQELSVQFAAVSQMHCGHLAFPTCRERDPFFYSSPPLEQSYLKLELISVILLDEARETLRIMQRKGLRFSKLAHELISFFLCIICVFNVHGI